MAFRSQTRTQGALVVKTSAFVFTTLLIASPLAAGTASRTFTGVIGDSMCVRDHAAMKIAPEDKCVRECVKHSSDVKYVLLTDDRHYILSDQAAPAQHRATQATTHVRVFEGPN